MKIRAGKLKCERLVAAMVVFGVSSAPGFFLSPGTASARKDTLLIEGAKVHPTVFITPEDIKRARENIARYDWARQTADAVIREADVWLKKDDAWLRSVIPAPGAAFAYGIVACPLCEANWGPFAREGASFDKPGRVTCSNGHTMPDKDHPDPGTGYIGPDGRTIHYFVGAYNSWVVETLTFKAVQNLVYAYSITGEEKYAAKASLILDALAAIYPSCHKGPWDYPSSPPSGRLDRPWYQASRVLIHYVDFYDQLFNSKSMDLPSVWKGMTRRRNIEENMLKDGGAYCYEQSKAGSLHNGEADYLRGALAVGVCLGIPEYVRWAVEGPFGIKVLLENNIDRDGGYYETTPMYADHTRELYWTFAEPLLNYKGSVYPDGLDIYQNPKFRAFLTLHNLPLHIAGLLPRFGDAPPNFKRREIPGRPFDRSDYDFMEKLYGRVKEPPAKKEIGKLLSWLAGGDIDKSRKLESTGDLSGLTIPDRRMSAGFSMYREPGDPLGGGFTERMWVLFHAGEVPKDSGAAPKEGSGLSEEWERRLLKSDFMGQKGIAVLRAGAGRNSQGVFLRFGPSLNHGHLDDLGINYIARGYELTYDIGYGRTAATQTQSSWAKQTFSHNLVVVDEKSQAESGETGGSLHLFADAPQVKVAEASSEASYAKLGAIVYRRLTALIGEGPGSYLIDIFRVRGGKQHDYVFHALGEKMEITGAGLGPEEPGSLAGPDIDWSALQGSDGDIRGNPNAWYWIAPPGNGYGFAAGPKRGRTSAGWSADWTIDPRTHLRLTMAASSSTELITALANGLYPHYPKSRLVVARRRGTDLASEFIAAIEPHGGEPIVKSVERLVLTSSDQQVVPIAVKITRKDGAVDYIFSASDETSHETEIGFRFAGRFAHIRVKNGRADSTTLVGMREFAGPGIAHIGPAGSWSGRLTGVDLDKNVITTDAQLPADGTLNGAVIYFDNPGYSRNTAYRIVRIEKSGALSRIHLHASPKLGIGRVASIPDAKTLTTDIPHEYANSVARNGGSGFFKGKRIRTASGATARITSIRYGNPMTLTVDSTAGLKIGDSYIYEDIRPGDNFQILSLITDVPGE